MDWPTRQRKGPAGRTIRGAKETILPSYSRLDAMADKSIMRKQRKQRERNPRARRRGFMDCLSPGGIHHGREECTGNHPNRSRFRKRTEAHLPSILVGWLRQSHGAGRQPSMRCRFRAVETTARESRFLVSWRDVTGHRFSIDLNEDDTGATVSLRLLLGLSCFVIRRGPQIASVHVRVECHGIRLEHGQRFRQEGIQSRIDGSMGYAQEGRDYPLQSLPG